MVSVAQLVERWIVAPVAEGSSPFTHPFSFQPGSFDRDILNKLDCLAAWRHTQMRVRNYLFLVSMIILALAASSFGEDSDLAKAAKKEKERRSKIQHAKVITNQDMEEFKKTHPKSESYITVQNQSVEGEAADASSDSSQGSEGEFKEYLIRLDAATRKQEDLNAGAFQSTCDLARNRVEELKKELQAPGGIPSNLVDSNPTGSIHTTSTVWENGHFREYTRISPLLKPKYNGVPAEGYSDKVYRLKQELEAAEQYLGNAQQDARRAGHPCN